LDQFGIVIKKSFSIMEHKFGLFLLIQYMKKLQ